MLNLSLIFLLSLLPSSLSISPPFLPLFLLFIISCLFQALRNLQLVNVLTGSFSSQVWFPQSYENYYLEVE